MSFKFEFKVDYNQLTKLLEAFLKRHADELLGDVIAPSMVLKAGEDEQVESPKQVTVVQAPEQTPIQQLPVSTDDQEKIIDNKPLIGDELPEDPFKNLFQNSNQDDTRFKDRNNIYNKKGHMLRE